ncbi:hypothetical protein ACPCT8_04530 [Aeromonas media]|uniref:hypothetical protein n=1 Tax=Aeromonas media TaxID=651 RepID=UPI003CFFC5ED
MKQTISNFTSTPSPLVSAYSKLVAIELALISVKPIYSHNVPAKLSNYAKMKKRSVYTSHSSSLQSLLPKIIINIKPSKPIPAIWSAIIGKVPAYSYPYMRYTRFQADYPGQQCVDTKGLIALNSTLDKIIIDLRNDGEI